MIYYSQSFSCHANSIASHRFAIVVCLVRIQALAEQQKAQQLAQQQQAGTPQVAAAPGQAQTPAAGQAQVAQATAVAGAAAVPNAAVLVSTNIFPSPNYTSPFSRSCETLKIHGFLKCLLPGLENREKKIIC